MTLTKNLTVGKRVIAFIAVISAALLMFGYGTSRLEADPSSDIPVNQSLTAEDVPASEPSNERLIWYSGENEIRFLGVDSSKDMWSYLTEKNPEILDYTEVHDGSPPKSKTAGLCDNVFLMRSEELKESGARNVAYGIADGQFTFAANFGERGNFAVTFDLGSLPTETDIRFDRSLEKLLYLLNHVEAWLSIEEARRIEEVKARTIPPSAEEDAEDVHEEIPKLKEHFSPPLTVLIVFFFVLFSMAYLLKGGAAFLAKEIKGAVNEENTLTSEKADNDKTPK